jgi:hypothetical protein
VRSRHTYYDGTKSSANLIILRFFRDFNGRGRVMVELESIS